MSNQWLFMSHNLIFMGMHFAIGKRELIKDVFGCLIFSNGDLTVYANSLLVT
jgi:hypothetical protein